jgi:hypothetical protein
MAEKTKMTQDSLAVLRPPSPAKFVLNSGSITRHTMPSKFHAKSLKTNDGRTNYSTHISRRGYTPFSGYARLF